MKYRILLEHFVSVVILLILLIYTFVELTLEPYRGFYFNEVTGEIITVFVPQEDGRYLQAGDIIERVGSVSWAEFRSDLRLSLFKDLSPGRQTEIAVTRDGESISVTWTTPGRTSAEFGDRLANVWWLAYFFWLAGLATVVVIRPVALRQQLLVAFLYLTALWLMLGAIGGTRLWHSAVLFRSVIWLSLPVYLHLHWVFPDPIKPIPTRRWVPLYLIGIGLAFAEWFQLPPVNAFAFGILIAMAGSLSLLLLHFAFKKEQRRDIAILGSITFVAFVPSIIYLSIAIVTVPIMPLVLGLFALTGLPGAYFYVAYRRQPGWLEIRANRIVALYLYLILIFGLALFAAVLIARNEPGDSLIALTTLAISCIAIVGIIGFPTFQRLIERRLLGLPLAPEQVVEAHTLRITTSLSRANLAKLLGEEILPSLQIRQSALVQKFGGQQPQIIYIQGSKIDRGALKEELELLPWDHGKTRTATTKIPSWLRFNIPLTLDDQIIGQWLLGKHDPNDVYSAADIRTLELLAHQTAIALANLNKKEQLQMLYGANIQRQEEERTRLARTLHDDVINDLIVLSMLRHDGERFAATYEVLVDRLRLIIRGLRPAMLDYGLWRTVDDLLDDLQDRTPQNLVLTLDITKSEARYAADIEQHLFRIVQQAVENALEHAQANTITIRGQIEQNRVEITIADDGSGLANAQNLDFSSLLAAKHYGLVGMFERAELIGAQLNITSRADEFTHINLVWHAPDDTITGE